MSISTASNDRPTRPYRLGKRAEKQEATRRKITEAAVELHAIVGPARTSIAQIAERAGVERHTYYAHFPTERDLMEACSGLALDRDPLPDVEQWTALPCGTERLRKGLRQLYCWYERNEQLTSSVLRDAEVHDLTREIVERRMAPTFARAREVLGEGLGEPARAMLGVVIDFACWRVLSRTCDCRSAASLVAGLLTGTATGAGS